MQVEIRIDPRFKGPTLTELAPVIFDIEGKIEIPWGNSRRDLQLLDRYSSTDLYFTLVVRDYDTQIKTSVALGLWVSVDEETSKSVREGLTRQSSTSWRALVDSLGASKAVSVMTHIAGSSIRSGKKPTTLVSVLNQCLHHGVSPSDADVLLRLQKLRGSK